MVASTIVPVFTLTAFALSCAVTASKTARSRPVATNARHRGRRHIAGRGHLGGHYRDREDDIAWLTEEGYADRLAKEQAAKAKYEATGEIDYVAGVDEVDRDVGMPGKFVWDWYQVWADKGLWDNRYAVMSDADLLPYESISAARTLTKPYLLIHSDNSYLPMPCAGTSRPCLRWRRPCCGKGTRRISATTTSRTCSTGPWPRSTGGSPDCKGRVQPYIMRMCRETAP